jgi:hypothetical protein
MLMKLFSTYEEWRSAITGPCGLVLSPDYCRSRLTALAEESDPATSAFVAAYGSAYRDQVASWFERAEREAVS